MSPENKTLAIHDAAGAAGVVQIGMSGDSAVDDGHADAGAVKPILRGRDISLDCGSKLLGRRIRSHAQAAIGRNIGDIGIVRQLRQHAGGNVQRHRMNRVMLIPDRRAAKLHRLKRRAARHLAVLNDDRHHVVAATRALLQVCGKLGSGHPAERIAIQNRLAPSMGRYY